eukprot:403367666
MVYFYMQGSYVNAKGEVIKQGDSTKDELSEKIDRIDVFYGSKVSYELQQFVKRMLDNYKKQFIDKIVIEEVKQKGESLVPLWVEIEEKAIFLNSEVDFQWPCERNDNESESYPYPYQISNTQEWKTKTGKEIEQTFEDTDNVRFKLISLAENDQKVLQYQMLQKNVQTTDLLEFKERYILPYTIFLWHGADINIERKKGSIYIIKTFLNSKLNEQINYQPSYFEENSNTTTIKFRIENQYYESQRFKSVFEKVWNDDRLDYLMMALQRNIENEQSSESEGEENEDRDQFNNFERLTESHKSNYSRLPSEAVGFLNQLPKEKTTLSKAQRPQRDPTLVKKRSITIAENKSLFQRRGTQLQNKKSDFSIGDGMDQKVFAEQVYSVFDPFSILGKISNEKESIKVNVKFDQIIMFSLQGSKFELENQDAYDTGVFDASKAYFIVFTKQNLSYSSQIIKDMHAVYLWRGQDQSQLNLAKAISKFLETEFRSIKLNQQTVSSQFGKRSSLNSTVSPMMMKSSSINQTDDFHKIGQSESLLEQSLPKIKKDSCLTPIASLKFAQKENSDQIRVKNMRAQIDDMAGAINMRTIIMMDYEPQHFLQAFQGSMIIRTNDYLKQIQGADYDGDDQKSQNYKIMFQLVGVPCLNQKAREVSPFLESLTSSGLYIVLTTQEVYFWIGQDYFDFYLNEETYQKSSKLIGESLLKKLINLYNTLNEDLLEETRQISYHIQGRETKRFIRLMKYGPNTLEQDHNDDLEYEGIDQDLDDMQYIKYESKVLKNLILPQEPRLFCLMLNGLIVEYESENQNEEQQKLLKSERESLIFKEIHNFNQKSLDQKGAFLLDFCSEAFIWIGKKVADQDRLLVFQIAYQTICGLHPNDKDYIERMSISLIESGFEPELFKKSFKDGWQHFDHTTMVGIQESSEEESDKEESKQETQQIQQKKSKLFNIEIIPENFWIN